MKDQEIEISLGKIVIFVIFLLFTIFLIFLYQKVSNSSVDISIYFKIDAKEEEILEFKDEIEKNFYIKKIKYIDQNEAFDFYKETMQDDFVYRSIKIGDLPASFDVTLEKKGDLNNLINFAKEKEIVDEVIKIQKVSKYDLL